MARTNIINTATGQQGYQVPGAAIPTGWSDMNPSATSPAKAAYTASLASTYKSPGAIADEANMAAGTPVGTVGEAKTDYLSTYRNYLNQYAESLNETPEVTAARTQLGDIQTAGDQKSLDARKAYEDLIHTSGMTKGGALEAGSVSNRNNAYILANLGVAESGAARKLDALTGSQTARQNYLKTLAGLSQPIQVGDQYIDPTTGQAIPQAPKERSGIIGEYEYAKQQGYTGTFEQYQNEDANRKRAAAPKETGNSINQILDGFTRIADLTPTEQTKVRAELYELGFNSDTIPPWFKEFIQSEKQMTLKPTVLQQEWTKYRDEIMAGAEDSGLPSWVTGS